MSGLVCEGSLDLEGDYRTETDDAMAAVKANGVELELDLVLVGVDEDDGVRTLHEIDVAGVALKPTLTGWKAIKDHRAATLRELRRKSDELMMETALGCTIAEFEERNAAEPEPDPERRPTEDELRAKSRELGLRAPARRRASHRVTAESDFETVRAEAYSLMVGVLRGAGR